MIRALLTLSISIILPVLAFGLDYGKEEKLDVPVREFSLIASEEGYYPSHLTVFKGERVKFFVTSTTERSTCFMMPKKEIFLAAEKGEISEGEAYFDQVGTYKYYCPTGNIKGKLTVLPRKKKKRKEAGATKPARSVASKPIWRPREE